MRSAGMRLVRAQWAPLTALAVLTLVSALLAVAVPSRTTAGYDRAAAAAAGPGADIHVKGEAGGSAAFAAVPSDAALNANALAWRDRLPRSLAEVTGEPESSVTSPSQAVDGEFRRPRLLYLGWEPGAWRRIRVVSGGFPFNKTGQTSGDMNAMVAKRYADQLGYKVGDRIGLGDLTVRVSGLYEPVNAADQFWGPRARILHPTIEYMPQTTIEADAGTALIDPAAYSRLTRDPRLKLNYDWRFPLRTGVVSAEQVRAMTRDLDAFRSAVEGRADLFPCEVSTALDNRLKEFAGRLRTARSVVGLAFGGLVAVAAGLLLLAAGLLGERLRPILGVMRARGASLRQLAAPACGLTALAAVPSALLGYAAGRLLDAGPPQTASLYAIGLLVAAVLGLPAAMVLRERGGGLGSVTERRDDLVAARPSRRRLVLDGLLVVLAVVGVVLLRERGASSGTDPLVASVPALLGAALGVLVLRAYPYLLRAAGPFLRRRTGAVAFIGVARASRQNLVGALPLAVLLLAATIAGFTSTVDTALRTGQERASWAETGGDARVDAESLDDAGLRRIRAVPGVTGAVRARVIARASSATDPAPLTVVGVDLDAYRRLAPEVPGIPDTGAGALVSPLAARTLGPSAVTLSRAGMDPVTVKASAQIERFPGLERNSAFVIVPYRAVAGATGFPSQVFLTGHDIDAKALRAAAPGDDVVMRRQVLRNMTGLPLVSVVHDTFRDSAIAGGVYGLLAVLLVLVVGARARGRMIAHLRALGLSRRQSRRLALVELAPVLLCAVGAGWVLGLLLPEITGPVVDLRPYTGGFAVTAHVPGLPALLGLLAALLLAAAAAVAVDRAFDTDPGNALRTGE
ncbi:putative ABC transport system permease protein [Actinomadura glauciflava]|uniref:CRISPR-associated protein Cas5 n=1 Tax=Actinomadura luteofluorescens TaxID=46163 RepID=UPI002164C8EB|nr:CRISPR-associated protein Cas5 [Actinomadura glauciflava]MCR3744074.1 putative ABC transport system permease protein [Actinomadura glauciflava]